MSNRVTESDLLVSMKAALAMEALPDVMNSLVHIASMYIERGLTQEGADVLAYVLRREDVPVDIYERAEVLWEDLARWICPRVLLDAQDFSKKAYLNDVIDYVLAGARTSSENKNLPA